MSKNLLVILICLPLTAWFLAKKHRSDHVFQITGASLGLVISPVSLALTSLSTFPIIGLLFGLIGSFFLVIHGMPGYFMAASVGFISLGKELTTEQQFLADLLNGMLWSFVYGMIGFYFDNKRLR